MNFISHIFLLINFGLLSCKPKLPQFFRGRPMDEHGMLGIPRTVPQFFESLQLPEEQWFDQKLNHLDPKDTTTWKQRFFYSDQFYKSGGPVFLQMGGESAASPIWMVQGPIAKRYAEKFQAMNVILEHRYYGNSKPTPNVTVENLQYLTSEQALQDTASFIEYFTSKLSLKDSKWIVFGGSYSGSLAAWFRAKYPQLAAGAIAASAPVEAIINFKDYLGVVSKALGENCDNAIKEATTQFELELKKPEGRAAIEKQFKLCSPLNGTDTNDIDMLMSSIAGNFKETVQYSGCNRDFGIKLTSNISSVTIDKICGLMTDTTLGSALQRYGKVNDLILDAYNNPCVSYKYGDIVKLMANPDWKSPSASVGARQWIYQTCAEFGFFQTTDLKSQPFGPHSSADFWIKQCTDIFGPKFNLDSIKKAVENTNNVYGGFQLKVQKVFFTSGTIDPWHPLNIVKDLNKDSKAHLIKGTAHCADMFPESDNDLQDLKNTRIQIMDNLSKFLSQS